MSLVAGVDIGSTTAKCVILGEDRQVLGKCGSARSASIS